MSQTHSNFNLSMIDWISEVEMVEDVFDDVRFFLLGPVERK